MESFQPEEERKWKGEDSSHVPKTKNNNKKPEVETNNFGPTFPFQIKPVYGRIQATILKLHEWENTSSYPVF